MTGIDSLLVLNIIATTLFAVRGITLLVQEPKLSTFITVTLVLSGFIAGCYYFNNFPIWIVTVGYGINTAHLIAKGHDN